ncbi:MAG: ankyrin repeat domain-containing protein [Vicinamibacterales bacterium]
MALSRWIVHTVPVGLLCLALTAGDAAAASDSRLADALQRQETSAVAALLAKGADPNGRQADGTTALSWAAHWDDLATADRLLKAGAQANVANDLGVTPLALACQNGSIAMATRLIEAGADTNAAKKTGETPVMTAAFTGNAALVALLLKHGADPNRVANDTKQTALMWAISERHSDVVNALVAAGADVKARTDAGFSPLLFAARSGDVASARLLLDSGADPNDRARDGSSVLVVAVASGREDVAELLLERGADPNAAGSGYTALHVAVPKDLRRAVKALLAKGADPNARVKSAPATLFGPGRGAGSEVPPLPGEPAVPPSQAASFAGATPFWLAAKHVNVEVMEILRAAGADISLTNDTRTTPLMVAAGITQVQGPRAKRGDVSQFYSNWGEADALETIRYLLRHGASIETRNASGQTALHGAAYMGSKAVAALLLDKGAAIDAQDSQGQTPYRLAEGHLNVASQGVTEWPETAALFKARGANTSLGVDGRTMLRQYVSANGDAPARSVQR